jgi:hypothetical protein
MQQIEAAMKLVAADLGAPKLVEVTNERGKLEVCVGGQFGSQPVENWGRAVGLGGIGSAHRLRDLLAKRPL